MSEKTHAWESEWFKIIRKAQLEFINSAQKQSVDNRIKRRIADRVEEEAQLARTFHVSKFWIFGTNFEESLLLLEERLITLRRFIQYKCYDSKTQERVESRVVDFVFQIHRDLKNRYKGNE